MFNNKKYTLLFILFLLLLSSHSKADITLPKIIGSNMVLQRNRPVAIWGIASVGERISVQFCGQTKKATADASGKWQVLLDNMNASARPAKLTISGNNTITLEN